MNEITELRTYNSKVFSIDETERIQRVWPVPRHYFNKLGVGDGKPDWREVDHTLSFNPSRNGWEFLFNNFIPLLPEYADEIIEFRDIFQGKDQTIKYRARANHVLGEISTDPIPNALNGNYVVYTDAFGEGIDLILGFRWTKLVKLIRIRKGFYPSADINFDFEVYLPGTKVDIYNSSSLKTAESGVPLAKDNAIDSQKAALLDNTKSLYIGKDQGDGKNWFTVIKPFRIWDSGVPGLDSGMKSDLLPWQFFSDAGVIVMRKTVSASFFPDVVGDVFTDAITDYQETKDTYYGTSFTTGGAPDSTAIWYGGWGDHYYGYVEWDLTNSPSDPMTMKAMVAFFVASVPPNDPVPKLYQVTSTWTEAGVTLASHPTNNATPFATVPTVMTIGYKNTDITVQYKRWKNGTDVYFGLNIRDTGSNSNAQGSFASSDETDVNKLPFLDLSYFSGTFREKKLRPAIFKPGSARLKNKVIQN